MRVDAPVFGISNGESAAFFPRERIVFTRSAKTERIKSFFHQRIFFKDDTWEDLGHRRVDSQTLADDRAAKEKKEKETPKAQLDVPASQELKTAQGYVNILAETGHTVEEYRRDTKAYIEEKRKAEGEKQ